VPSTLGFPHRFGFSMARRVFFAQRKTIYDPWFVFSAISAPLREKKKGSRRGAEDAEKKSASGVVDSLCA
jgi:hypothetical protein